MKRRALRVLAAAALCALAPPVMRAAPPLGPEALRARHEAQAAQLAHSPFGGPLLLQSAEAEHRIEGDVYAVIARPFAEVSAALADPGHWCDILILHLNTKQCRRVDEGSITRVDLRVGKKQQQAPQAATLLSFRWQAATRRPDYLAVAMDAGDGPYDTSDYLLVAEAVPLDATRSFLHMGYGFRYGAASQLALQLYLGTWARDKVGFTREHGATSRDEGLVGGMRAVAERNTMRYYLAIQSYLAAPGEQQLEQRLAGWFDGTERYPRQLHEIERDAYLRMKRAEVQRQAAAH